MYDNRNWLWQYQDKPVMKTLYDGLFTIMSETSSLPVLDLLNVDSLNQAGVLTAANIYNIKVVGGVTENAFTWSVNQWNDPEKFWSGVVGQTDSDFFKRYIKMKLSLFGRPFSIATIKQCLDILIGDYGTAYTCDIIENEEEYSFAITITVQDATIIPILESTISSDRFMFGKPSGHSYEITVQQQGQ